MRKKKWKTIIWIGCCLCFFAFLACAVVFGVQQKSFGPRSVSGIGIWRLCDSDAGESFFVIDSDGNIRETDGRDVLKVYDLNEILSSSDERAVDARAAGRFLYVVTESRRVLQLSLEGELLFEGRVIGIPTSVDGDAEGKYATAVTSSSASERAFVFDIGAENMYKAKLDCKGIRMTVSRDALGNVQFYLFGRSVDTLVFDDDFSTADGDGYLTCVKTVQADEFPAALAQNGSILFGLFGDQRVYALDLNTGEWLWRSDVIADGAAVCYDAPSNAVRVATSKGLMVQLSEENGKTESSVSTVNEISAAVCSTSGETLIRTQVGSTYLYESGSFGQVSAARVLKIVFLVLTIVFLCVLFVLACLFIDRANRTAHRFLAGVKKYRIPFFVLVPVLLLLVVFNYYPAVSGMALSFTEYKPGSYMRWVGFQNFAEVFKVDYFWTSFGNLGILLATGIFKALIPPIIMAELILALRSTKFRYLSRVLLYLPGILPGVAGMLLWTNGIYGVDGLLSQGLKAMGLGGWIPTEGWLGNENTVMWMLVFIGFPWIGSYLIFYGALMNIPQDYYEAAKLEGCGWWRRLVTIDLPQILPQIKYIFVVTFIGAVQEFNLVYLTTQGGPGHASYTPMLVIYENLQFGRYGIASAMSVIMFLILFAATTVNLRMRTRRD